MTRAILEIAGKHIPQRVICSKKSSHAWLTDEIVHLVSAKRAAAGTPAYDDAVKACSAGIMAEYSAYTSHARHRLLDARKGSKRWRSLCQELLSQCAKVQSIPALKCTDGGWVHEPADKADLLAITFGSKNVLPQLVTNDYTDLGPKARGQKELSLLTVEVVIKTLAALDERSGTGPDLLPARILKNCAEQLAYPIMQLAFLILNSGEWPESWREH
jgi:hypothetical protein